MNISVKDFECVGFSGFYQGVFDYGERVYDIVREDEEYNDIPRGSLEWDEDYTFDSASYKEDVCKGWAKIMEYLIDSYLGIDCVMSTPTLWQPRTYNYSNDRLFCEFRCKHFKKVMRTKILPLMRKHKEKLSTIIYENHTSCDGFVSFMPNTFDGWYQYLACSKNYNDKNFFLYFSHIVIYLIGLEKYPYSKRIGEDLLCHLEQAVYEDYEDAYCHLTYVADMDTLREKYSQAE